MTHDTNDGENRETEPYVTIGLCPDGLPVEMLPDCKMIENDGVCVLLARRSSSMLAMGFLQGWIAARNTPQEDYYEDDDTHIQDAIAAAIKLGVKPAFARRIGEGIDGSKTCEAALRTILSSWQTRTASVR